MAAQGTYPPEGDMRKFLLGAAVGDMDEKVNGGRHAIDATTDGRGR